MATSWRCSATSVATALLMIAGHAQATDCASIGSTFFIYNWQGDAPASASVHVLTQRGATRQESLVIDYGVQVSSAHAPVGNVLTLKPLAQLQAPLLAADDYSIVLDGGREYLVHDIQMPVVGNTGCLIKSAMANSCRLGPSRAIEIDSKCSATKP